MAPARNPLTLVAALTAALLGLTVLVGAPAGATGNGGLSGRVTNTAGVAQPAMDVTVFQAGPGGWVEAATTETEDDGSWTLALPAGTYRLQVEDPFGDYVTQWWRNAATVEAGTDIAVAEGPAAGGYDVVLGADPAVVVNLVAPTIQGTPAYDARLSAAPGQWSKAVTFTYAWSVAGQPRLKATGPTFVVPTPSDPTKVTTVLLTVTASAADGESVDADAEPLRVDGKGPKVATTLRLVKAPAVKGIATSGGRLVVKPGRVTPRAVATYQWLRGARPVKGGTTRTYRPGASDVGHKLRVRVTYTRAGLASLVVRTKPTAKVRG